MANWGENRYMLSSVKWRLEVNLLTTEQPWRTCSDVVFSSLESECCEGIQKRLFFEMITPINFYMTAQTICYELPCWLIWKENLFSFSFICALRISLLVDLEREFILNFLDLCAPPPSFTSLHVWSTRDKNALASPDKVNKSFTVRECNWEWISYLQ